RSDSGRHRILALILKGPNPSSRMYCCPLELAMSQQNAFADALDAAEQLDADGQAELVAVLSRRLAERGRERVAAAVAEARREFAAGQCQPMTAAELVHEAQS